MRSRVDVRRESDDFRHEHALRGPPPPANGLRGYSFVLHIEVSKDDEPVEEFCFASTGSSRIELDPTAAARLREIVH